MTRVLDPPIQPHLTPPLTTEEGLVDAIAAIWDLARDEHLPAPLGLRPSPFFGYIAVELATVEAWAAWSQALAAADHHPQIPDVDAHGTVEVETWGWIRGHHVDLWTRGALPPDGPSHVEALAAASDAADRMVAALRRLAAEHPAGGAL